MRIGILTLPFNLNYGGFLQAYALMTILKRLGHEPTMIMRRHNKKPVSILYRVKFALKGMVRTLIHLKKFPIFYNNEVNYYYQGKDMLRFVNKYIQPQTCYLYSREELRKVCKDKFDAYIVGSDQVWRPDYVPNIYSFFLDFTKGWDVKRIAYAASFGGNNVKYSDEQIKRCRELINDFDAISLRESSSTELFSKYSWSKKSLDTVLDPTMLLTKEDYIKLLSPQPGPGKGKILSYILDKNKLPDGFGGSIKDHLKKDLYEFPVNRTIKPSIEDWLCAFRDCDYVITDSFHGTVFSIIFNKPFLVLVNKERGAERFYDLLETTGLKDRMYLGGESTINCVINNEIDWTKVNMELSNNRQLSLNFISSNLQ